MDFYLQHFAENCLLQFCWGSKTYKDTVHQFNPRLILILASENFAWNLPVLIHRECKFVTSWMINYCLMFLQYPVLDPTTYDKPISLTEYIFCCIFPLNICSLNYILIIFSMHIDTYARGHKMLNTTLNAQFILLK